MVEMIDAEDVWENGQLPNTEVMKLAIAPRIRSTIHQLTAVYQKYHLAPDIQMVTYVNNRNELYDGSYELSSND